MPARLLFVLVVCGCVFAPLTAAAQVDQVTTTPPAADDLVVRNLLRNDPVRTAVDISTTGLIYSLSYQF